MGVLDIGSYIVVTLVDGTVIEGEIVRLGKANMVIDDVSAFGDWVVVEFNNIMDIRWIN